MNEELSGIVGSPVTPFKQDGSLDLGTLAKQVEFLIANDIDAITYPMHISESLNLSEDERKLAAKNWWTWWLGAYPLLSTFRRQAPGSA